MVYAIRQQHGSKQKPIDTSGDAVECRTWEFHDDPHKLPDLPPLPLFVANTSTKEVYLIKIAGLNNHLLGLTNHGHVLTIHLEGGNVSAWEYVSHVCFRRSHVS